MSVRVAVVGVGGCGVNVIKHMAAARLSRMAFIAVDSDPEALSKSQDSQRIQIGKTIPRESRMRGDPEVGRTGALEDKALIRNTVVESKVVFVVAGMGGGTGTGAAPVIARIARDAGALTIGVITTPFDFEGSRRNLQAKEGLRKFRNAADTLVTIPNQRVLSFCTREITLREAFQRSDEVLMDAVRGVSDHLTILGLINLDLATVRSIMGDMGMASVGSASARGEKRVADAVRGAISSPIFEDGSLKHAHGLVVSVTGGRDLRPYEAIEAVDLIQKGGRFAAKVAFGAIMNESLPADEIRVTVIAIQTR
ncbi:MAG: cell division protein FtsZ [Terriglobia bacterium]